MIILIIAGLVSVIAIIVLATYFDVQRRYTMSALGLLYIMSVGIATVIVNGVLLHHHNNSTAAIEQITQSCTSVTGEVFIPYSLLSEFTDRGISTDNPTEALEQLKKLYTTEVAERYTITQELMQKLAYIFNSIDIGVFLIFLCYAIQCHKRRKSLQLQAQ